MGANIFKWSQISRTRTLMHLIFGKKDSSIIIRGISVSYS